MRLDEKVPGWSLNAASQEGSGDGAREWNGKADSIGGRGEIRDRGERGTYTARCACCAGMGVMAVVMRSMACGVALSHHRPVHVMHPRRVGHVRM
jgi:hypothetical protein